MRRKKKAYMDSEDCTNTIKQLLTAQVARTNNTDETSFLNPPAANVNELSPVRVDTRALNESVGCDMWNLSARSLRRNLDARREQAEMLNRSFEERTKDIEQRTKESIAVQIVKYDHVIAERTSLLSILDEISLEQNPALQSTTTPRRAGVEPLDLSQLSSEENTPVIKGKDSAIVPSLEKISQSLQEEQSQSHVDQDHADVGISRAYSQSTVYEDSLSRFDEEEGSRSGSAGSEATLYRSDLEDEATEISKSQQHTQPSRRTLDTAEALTMLSRQIVTVIGDNTTRVEVDQILERIVEENVEVKVAVAKKDAAVNEGNIGEKLHKAEVSEDMNTITDREPLSTDVQEIGNDGKFKADVVENRDEAGDAARSSYESTKIEVSMTKPSEVEDGTQKCLPDKNAPPCDEIFLDISLGRDEVDEQGRKLQDKYVQMSDSKECNDFESTQRENFEAMSLLSSVQKPKEKLTAQRDDTIFEETFDAEKESEGEWLSEDEDSSAVLESKNRPEGTEAENVADIGKHEEINAWKSEEVTTGYDADGRDETSGKVASSSPQLSTTAEELIPTSKTNALELASATTSSRVLTDDQIGNEAATAILAVTPADDKILAGENQETDSYELSFLDRIPDRTVDGRASLGLNRSELCDSLSTSIMHLMTDSPRRRSLPRSYNLSDSLLDDSVPVLVTKSPRAAKERFNTKMPGPFSPRMQLLLENSLDTSIVSVMVIFTNRTAEQT
ncbi:hypothetical protein Y032_0909g3000 [Ancylostoma ceylanicum]|nr:hypothetical protein Y032_0909g3000 [Ancylostoma ceylanicum]